MTRCVLTDKNSNEKIEYTCPIYTKMNGVYGYITVSLLTVNFFWCDCSSEEAVVRYDDITEKFSVEYIIK